jgi:hypothetical protein
MDVIRNDPALRALTQLEAPFLDMEVRGVPALQYFGQMVRSELPLPFSLCPRSSAVPCW